MYKIIDSPGLLPGSYNNSVSLGGGGVVNLVDIFVANSQILTVLGVWILGVVGGSIVKLMSVTYYEVGGWILVMKTKMSQITIGLRLYLIISMLK